MSNENTQTLAEKIASLLQNELQYDDKTSLRSSIDKINQRLDRIENDLGTLNPASQTLNPRSIHPSQHKYNVIEAIVDEVFEDMKQEKTCTFEPNGKPCDHCSMCSSHGF